MWTQETSKKGPLEFQRKKGEESEPRVRRGGKVQI